MEIRQKKVSELTPTEYLACKKANYGPYDGYMYGQLTNCRGGYTYGGIAIMLWDGPDDTVKSLLGWCLLVPVTRHGMFAVTDTVMRRSKYSAQFWVKRQHRKKGHAKTLMREVKKIDPRPHVIPHDEASSELFSAFEVQVMQTDSHWIKRGKPKVA